MRPGFCKTSSLSLAPPLAAPPAPGPLSRLLSNGAAGHLPPRTVSRADRQPHRLQRRPPVLAADDYFCLPACPGGCRPDLPHPIAAGQLAPRRSIAPHCAQTVTAGSGISGELVSLSHVCHRIADLFLPPACSSHRAAKPG